MTAMNRWVTTGLARSVGIVLGSVLATFGSTAMAGEPPAGPASAAAETMVARDRASSRTAFFPVGAQGATPLGRTQREAYLEQFQGLIELAEPSEPVSTAKPQRTVTPRQAYERPRAAAGQDPRLVWAYGLVVASRGETATAITVLTRLIDQAPEARRVIRLELASLQLEQGDLEAGLESARKIVRDWQRDEPRDQAVKVRETEIRWLAQVLGYLTGVDEPTSEQVEALRRSLPDSWSAADVSLWEREFQRVSDARRRQSERREQQRAETTARKEELRGEIQRLQQRERRMQDEILDEKRPWELSRDNVLAQLRVHNDQLRRVETEMKQLQSQRQRVLNGGLQPSLIPFVVASPVDQFSAGRMFVGNLTYAEQLRRRKERESERERRRQGRDGSPGWNTVSVPGYVPPYSWGATLVDDSFRRMQIQRELNRIDDQLGSLQQAAEPLRQQLGAGRVLRQELEGELRGTLTPLKRDLDRVRLGRQTLQKELQQLAASSRAAQESSAVDRFREWRTVSEQDLLRDLQRHWGE